MSKTYLNQINNSIKSHLKLISQIQNQAKVKILSKLKINQTKSCSRIQMLQKVKQENKMNLMNYFKKLNWGSGGCGVRLIVALVVMVVVE